MVSNTESIHNWCWINLLARAKQMPSKALFVGKKMWRPFSQVHTKIIVIFGSNKN